MRTLSLFVLSLLLVCFTLTGCDDGGGNSTADTTVAETTDLASEVDSVEEVEVTEETVEDVPFVFPPSECTAPADADPATAVYDAFVLFSFVGEASVTKTGVDVLVEVDTETFTGAFEPGTNCIPARPLDGLLFPLCFMTADGVPAEPETLGAVLITGPDYTVGPVGAHRRGVDRSCSPSGHYVLTAANVVAAPDTTDTALVAEMMATYGEYLQLFELPTQTVAAVNKKEPTLINPLTLASGGFSTASVVQSIGDSATTEWSVTYTASDGVFNGDTLTFGLELAFDGIGIDNLGDAFTITAEMTGSRQ